MENSFFGSQAKQVPGTSSEILIGIFAHYADAQRAITTMLNTGFPAQLIQLYPQSETDISQAGNQHGGFEEGGTGQVLSSLISAGKYLKPRTYYAEAVRRGYHLVIVNARTDEQIDQAAAIMQRFKSIDFEERPSEAEQQVWTGYHENAENNRAEMTKPQSAIFPGGDQSDYRNHWQSTYASTEGRYEDYDAAYHYGCAMARCGQYKNVQSGELESQLRSGWESSHPGMSWEKVKDAVHYGAQRESMSRH